MSRIPPLFFSPSNRTDGANFPDDLNREIVRRAIDSLDGEFYVVIDTKFYPFNNQFYDDFLTFQHHCLLLYKPKISTPARWVVQRGYLDFFEKAMEVVHERYSRKQKPLSFIPETSISEQMSRLSLQEEPESAIDPAYYRMPSSSLGIYDKPALKTYGKPIRYKDTQLREYDLSEFDSSFNARCHLLQNCELLNERYPSQDHLKNFVFNLFVPEDTFYNNVKEYKDVCKEGYDYMKERGVFYAMHDRMMDDYLMEFRSEIKNKKKEDGTSLEDNEVWFIKQKLFKGQKGEYNHRSIFKVAGAYNYSPDNKWNSVYKLVKQDMIADLRSDQGPGGRV